MNNNIRVFVTHEEEVISRANRVLKTIKTFNSENSSVAKELDICSDELSALIASCQTFLNIIQIGINE